jgi:hypothetical protein
MDLSAVPPPQGDGQAYLALPPMALKNISPRMHCE